MLVTMCSGHASSCRLAGKAGCISMAQIQKLAVAGKMGVENDIQ